jgi:hypothetical protein
MTRKAYTGLALLSLLPFHVVPAEAETACSVTGQVRVPAVVGRSSAGPLPVEGALLFVCPPGDGTGISRYCPEGGFSFTVPEGEYSALIEPPDYSQRGLILESVPLNGESIEWNPELRPDYASPFSTITRGALFEQTFMARGTSITNATFKLAGRFRGAILEVSIGKGPNREVVGPKQTVEPENNPNISVSWNSGDVPTVPGETYCLRIADVDEEPLGLYVQQDQGLGYPYGELFIDGEKSGYDGYFIIGSNADGAVLTHSTRPGKELAAPVESAKIPFRANGSSLAAVYVPFNADGEIPEIIFQFHEGGSARGERVGPVKRTVPVKAGDGRYHAGIACPWNEIPLQPGKDYTLVVSSPPDQGVWLLKAENQESEHEFAARIYEYATEKADFQFPPPPVWEPDGSEETIPLSNAAFEEGNDSGWESAWGGKPFTAIAGADWMADKFSGKAKKPKEGEFCGALAADHTAVKKLIRQWASWDFPSRNGQVRAVVWVASSDGAAESENPMRIRICVSGHGSVDAGNVAWSEPVVSPAKWTPLVSPPATPAGGKMTLFLLIEGGSENEEHYVKVDDLRLIVDRK